MNNHDDNQRRRAFLYARFSPRPIPTTCAACGHAWKVDATGSARIFASCPRCEASTIIPNSESCESQLADLRDYCAQQNIEIAGEFSDRALSGGEDAKDRPGLFECKVTCRRGDILLVWKLDRLWRDMDRAAMFRAELAVKGVEIRSLTEPEATAETSTGKLLIAIYTWMAEAQRETIRATTRIRMRMHQANGRKMSQRPPFGFSVDPENQKRLVTNHGEQDVIRTIVSLREDHRMGLRQIARWLEDHNVPRRGKKTWTHQLVKSILQRAGALSAGKTQTRTFTG